MTIPIVTGVLLNAFHHALDWKALTFEFECTLLAIKQVLSVYVDVKPSLYTFVVLACSRSLPIGPTTLGSCASVVVDDGVFFGGECFAGHAACRGSTDVIDVELVLLVVFGVLADETASFRSRLHVVAEDKAIQFSQRLVKLDLHLTNITESQ